MPSYTIADHLLLAELELVSFKKYNRYQIEIIARKKQMDEYCPRCASLCRSTYDHRVVVLKDAPARAAKVRLLVHKRRL